MEISIPPYLREFIEKQVRSGRFKTSDDVIRSALAHFAGQDELSPDEIDELKRELSVGLDQANRGEFTSFTADDVVREGRELMAACCTPHGICAKSSNAIREIAPIAPTTLIPAEM